MFQTKVVEKSKHSFIFSENRAVYEIWKKYGKAGQATDDNIPRCNAHRMLDN